MVAGSPPRDGEPSAGSTRSALISAPCATALSNTARRTCAGQRLSARPSARCCRYVIVSTSAVAGSAPATAATIRLACASVAPAPPCSRGTTCAISPARCSRAKFSCGNRPSTSLRAASAASSGARRSSSAARRASFVSSAASAALARSAGRRRSAGCGGGEEAARLADIETDSLGRSNTAARRRHPRAPDHSRAHSVCATHAPPNHANLIFKSGLIISVPHDPGVNLRSIPARPCAGTSLHRRPR